MFMVETVLVTGGSGFIGGWCVRLLLERGYAVRATLRDRSGEAALREAVGAVGAEGDARLTVHVADLTRDEGWSEAVAGCDYVLHVASPLGAAAGGGVGANDLVRPARDGTLRVLRAAVAAGVRRVVMTSAAATARARRGSGVVSDETVWADPKDPQFDGYRRSKILAERAAWDFMTSDRAAAHGRTTLTTILPVAVFGPVLSKANLGSVSIIRGVLEGRPSRLPRLGFWAVDVRDLADLHIRAMTAPQAAGQRFLAAGEHLWIEDIARVLRAALGARAARTPTKRMPDFVFRLASLFRPQLRFFTPDLGRKHAMDAGKARRTLGFAPRPGAETVVDCAESL
jgi:nucleoside-diphosphate-sugar epimerase